MAKVSIFQIHAFMWKWRFRNKWRFDNKVWCHFAIFMFCYWAVGKGYTHPYTCTPQTSHTTLIEWRTSALFFYKIVWKLAKKERKKKKKLKWHMLLINVIQWQTVVNMVLKMSTQTWVKYSLLFHSCLNKKQSFMALFFF